ncbi:nucleoside phosphorylase [Eisenibacter elegans]|jgi:uridine phosphorylase|uniref:nucleoside phosphorylase n=1 Tax=Eisenibacter elegans TaxID=997 RepID=UPI0004169359|nr:nucleoside phosphorylase [Eisenibacter elegans]
MTTPIPDSELIINPDGSIYHLHLRPEELANTIITVGDPDRVSMVSQYFDRIEVKQQKREFVTHTGYIGSKRLTVISSGIGTDNVEILLTELDALANIDFETRQVKTRPQALDIIRIGTSGTLRADIPLDTLLASVYGLGLDTLMSFYPLAPEQQQAGVAESFQQALRLPFRPYCVAGDASLRQQLAADLYQGNTLTAPGFYAPQGRYLRLHGQHQTYLETIQRFKHQDFELHNFEMETAGYYALAKLLGHRMLSLNAIVANRAQGQFSVNPLKTVDRLIQQTLERLSTN